MASIEITGIPELITKLGKAAATRTLRPAMNRSVLRLQRDMAKYPIQRVGSSYIRTGTLGRRWTTKVMQNANGLTGKVGNNTSYGPFVQSSMFQAEIHAGRWQTDQDTLDKNRSAIVKDFQNAIDEVLK